MNNPISLVTGASRGIGRATCVKLVQSGHHVIALARTIGGLEDLADEVGDEHITLIPQDLNDGKSLEAMGPMLFEKFGQLDNLIMNAGMLGTLTPLHQTDPKAWQDVFNVNVTANLHLIRTLHPLLVKAKKANVIFVTSSLATRPRAYWGGYAASKAALEAMAKIYEQETIETSIQVSMFDPGGTATRMRAQAFPGEDQSNLPSAEETADNLLCSFAS